MSMGGHQSQRVLKDEWLTPPELLRALGPFDLDPCAPITRPWDTAAKHYTLADNGLNQPWDGLVWCNPPYGPKAEAWMARMAEHNNGIALIFARTETASFQRVAWGMAESLLFLRGRLNFHHVDGTRAAKNAGAPSVLLAYGKVAAQRLRDAHANGLAGALVHGPDVRIHRGRVAP